ncbi:MAG TPA: zinc-binding dehydrogenase [Ktedonobacterales bacterium]|jgi:NADPH:quinone reductase-like Zn-dependent oxidoreductase
MASMMKAVVFHQQGGPEALRFEDVPRPEAGPGEAVIRVLACGANNLDLRVREGRVPGKIPMPHISGSEAAGEIAELGTGVTSFSVGQAVAIAPYLFCGQCEFCQAGAENQCMRGDILGLMSQGAYAEYVKVPASSLVPLPTGVDAVSAAAVGLAAITAWHMLTERARVQPGEDVLVHAAGSGVGSAAVQFARLAGARVIATAGSQDKLLRAKQLGADEVINYNEQDFAQEVRRITNKRGVQVVVEHIGQTTWEKSVACLGRRGRLVICGTTSGTEGKIDLWGFFAKELSFLGSYGGTRHNLAQVLKLVASGQFKPVIHRTFPLESVSEAQQIMAAREQFGKLIITPTK